MRKSIFLLLTCLLIFSIANLISGLFIFGSITANIAYYLFFISSNMLLTLSLLLLIYVYQYFKNNSDNK